MSGPVVRRGARHCLACPGRSEYLQMGRMNELSDTKRLAEATSGLASTILEIINDKLQVVATGQEQRIPQNLGERMLTKEQVAQHFQVCLRTIDNWMKRGHLPYYKIGYVVRFKLSEVEAMWNEQLLVG